MIIYVTRRVYSLVIESKSFSNPAAKYFGGDVARVEQNIRNGHERCLFSWPLRHRSLSARSARIRIASWKLALCNAEVRALRCCQFDEVAGVFCLSLAVGDVLDALHRRCNLQQTITTTTSTIIRRRRRRTMKNVP